MGDGGGHVHPHLPLWARSGRPRSVNVGTVLDRYDDDLALGTVDAVDHAVIASAGAVQTLEA
jgi:hypothetical protein